MNATRSNAAEYFFHQGTNYKAYEYLGSHPCENGGYVFRVWAPNATRIFLVGDFCDWQLGVPMDRVSEGGVWECTVENAKVGDRYKYKILNGTQCHLKSDPYCFSAECPPDTASVICDIEGYKWRDMGWLAYRNSKAGRMYSEPMNIYEVHLGSWKRHEDGEYYTYAELASELAPYVKQMGYTHIEIMPVAEHPFDGSWGYQICSYYAPTARYGSPKDFMAFVDSMHEAGIGVIVDWVPAHFPKDEHGLYEFDGQPLYEYQGVDRIEHAGWGTRRFDVGRNEVECFLVSNADFWLRYYHIDALRVDAVASMIYLDYDRRPDEWVPNVYGDNRCLEAIAFFRKLNSHIKGAYPDVLMIAEESTAWGNVTTFENGGLGFDMKWNMGWMNDTLAYAEVDPLYRKFEHEKMTFSLTYSFSEKYILPISHDEVVHGKKSFLDRMTGDYWQKFAGTRAFMGYMMTHPGKKLMFMGGEIGQFREWDYEGQIEWFLLDYDAHAKIQRFSAELNQLYLKTPALWQRDGGWDGFQWIDADNRDQSIISYRRIDNDGKEVIVLINFTPVTYEDYRIGVPEAGLYREILNSDDERYGGSGVVNTGNLKSESVPWNGLGNSIRMRVPPLAVTILKCARRAPKPRNNSRSKTPNI
ncbi:MAG: 1,4-alpha-glucan branching protein GlgB [Ruminococcaceae bacterium]|nr:1,4-alpha-glucan branching protein GlgB [Oscillospiraceae bacterium]